MKLQKASIRDVVPRIPPALLSFFLPLADIPAVVIEREPVLVAIILPAVLAVEREVDPLATDCAGFVHRVLLFPEKARDEAMDGCDKTHTIQLASTQEKAEESCVHRDSFFFEESRRVFSYILPHEEIASITGNAVFPSSVS